MTTVIVIIVVLVLLALAAGAYLTTRSRRRAELQDRFGPEYDRQVEAAGSRREAEQHLAGVAHERDKLSVRDLDESERARFCTEWDAVQARFVDEPAQAVDEAEQLISTVMRERGYPVDDFDRQADLVAVDHPDVVSHYREAHAAHELHRTSGALDTEALRQSFVHYRALFAELVSGPGASVPTASSTASSAASSTAGSTAGSTAVNPVAATTSDTPVSSETSSPDAPADEPHHQETR